MRIWFYFHDVNGVRIESALHSDLLGNPDFFHYRKHLEKSKYSSNKRCRYRDWRKKSDGLSYGLREKDKILTRKLINESLCDEMV